MNWIESENGSIINLTNIELINVRETSTRKDGNKWEIKAWTIGENDGSYVLSAHPTEGLAKQVLSNLAKRLIPDAPA
jgi:hypothetical protein